MPCSNTADPETRRFAVKIENGIVAPFGDRENMFPCSARRPKTKKTPKPWGREQRTKRYEHSRSVWVRNEGVAGVAKSGEKINWDHYVFTLSRLGSVRIPRPDTYRTNDLERAAA